jgi:hypothetical protein
MKHGRGGKNMILEILGEYENFDQRESRFLQVKGT